ncbi:p53-like transcription factor [Rhizopus microsporus ATCC 52813]|uniref:p53-like transcription factor n=1 Tax=Rhizopus microsporus ATCC 52813 TaxID=1340429 RepID=A0A2G4SJ52_RHIZD|nr:p53-like transcription factor [Rhizopus microsporus ATCC 52813]PHZ08772.1 p53-like transcription factor [Rhizopus microsporus ATCC 52813]
MSSQPNTPQPTATPPPPTGVSQDLSSNTANNHYPPSPPLPLETQKYDVVTPTQPPPRRSRKESYTDHCPSFGPVAYMQNVFAIDRHTCIDVRLYTKVDRGFFLADNDWTCYRRNYFQVSGSFSLEGIGVLYEGQEYPCYVKDSTGQLEEINCFMLGVSAKLSDCDKAIQLIQHTPKRDKGPQTTPTPKPIRPGGNLGFSAVGSGQTIVTFERLQFKTATANNGKRRAAQQYYVIVMELLAKLKNGNTVTVASTTSSPLVVRGRSPGHYAETDGAIRQPRLMTTASTGDIHQPSSSSGPATPNGGIHYGRSQGTNNSSVYAGHNSEMFQPHEYISYEYHNYSNYGHMAPPPTSAATGASTAPTTPMSHPHSYPGTPHHPMVAPQPSQHYFSGPHDRTHSAASTETYPNHHNNDYNENGSHHHIKEEVQQQQQQQQQQHHHSSPYYWQRSEEHHAPPPSAQDNWSRMRMASNNSAHSSIDHSQHGSPYMSHPHHPPPGPAAHDHPYYSHPYGHSPASYNHQGYAYICTYKHAQTIFLTDL